MSVSYYDALLPVREPGAGEPGTGLRDAVAGIRLPHRVLASIRVPAGRIVLAFVSDSARLSRMFAANWAQAGTNQEPDATLYALACPARGYGLDSTDARCRSLLDVIGAAWLSRGVPVRGRPRWWRGCCGTPSIR